MADGPSHDPDNPDGDVSGVDEGPEDANARETVRIIQQHIQEMQEQEMKALDPSGLVASSILANNAEAAANLASSVFKTAENTSEVLDVVLDVQEKSETMDMNIKLLATAQNGLILQIDKMNRSIEEERKSEADAKAAEWMGIRTKMGKALFVVSTVGTVLGYVSFFWNYSGNGPHLLLSTGDQNKQASISIATNTADSTASSILKTMAAFTAPTKLTSTVHSVSGPPPTMASSPALDAALNKWVKAWMDSVHGNAGTSTLFNKVVTFIEDREANHEQDFTPTQHIVLLNMIIILFPDDPLPLATPPVTDDDSVWRWTATQKLAAVEQVVALYRRKKLIKDMFRQVAGVTIKRLNNQNQFVTSTMSKAIAAQVLQLALFHVNNMQQADNPKFTSPTSAPRQDFASPRTTKLNQQLQHYHNQEDTYRFLMEEAAKQTARIRTQLGLEQARVHALASVAAYLEWDAMQDNQSVAVHLIRSNSKPRVPNYSRTTISCKPLSDSAATHPLVLRLRYARYAVNCSVAINDMRSLESSTSQLELLNKLINTLRTATTDGEITQTMRLLMVNAEPYVRDGDSHAALDDNNSDINQTLIRQQNPVVLPLPHLDVRVPMPSILAPPSSGLLKDAGDWNKKRSPHAPSPKNIVDFASTLCWMIKGPMGAFASASVNFLGAVFGLTDPSSQTVDVIQSLMVQVLTGIQQLLEAQHIQDLLEKISSSGEWFAKMISAGKLNLIDPPYMDNLITITLPELVDPKGDSLGVFVHQLAANVGYEEELIQALLAGLTQLCAVRKTMCMTAAHLASLYRNKGSESDPAIVGSDPDLEAHPLFKKYMDLFYQHLAEWIVDFTYVDQDSGQILGWCDKMTALFTEMRSKRYEAIGVWKGFSGGKDGDEHPDIWYKDGYVHACVYDNWTDSQVGGRGNPTSTEGRDFVKEIDYITGEMVKYRDRAMQEFDDVLGLDVDPAEEGQPSKWRKVVADWRKALHDVQLTAPPHAPTQHVTLASKQQLQQLKDNKAAGINAADDTWMPLPSDASPTARAIWSADSTLIYVVCYSNVQGKSAPSDPYDVTVPANSCHPILILPLLSDASSAIHVYRTPTAVSTSLPAKTVRIAMITRETEALHTFTDVDGKKSLFVRDVADHM